MNAMHPPKPWNRPSTEQESMLAVRRIYPDAVLRGVDGQPFRWKIASEVFYNCRGLVIKEGRALSDVCNTPEEAWAMAACRLKEKND